MEKRPSAVEFDDMYNMFSTPLICCSIGVTTVDATTSALAPGYWPETLMIGGAISGYCATGSRENETPPRMTKTIETTAAKIGRSIKKCEMRIFSSLLGNCGRTKIEGSTRCRRRNSSDQRTSSAADQRFASGSLNTSSGSCFVAALGRGSGRLGEVARIDLDAR